MVIGLVGHAGSGKSTVAEHLVMQYDYYRIGFADEIKYLLEHMELFTAEELWERKTPKARKALQELGTAVRNIDHLYWTRKGIERIQKTLKEGLNVVVDDVRFLDEAAAIHALDGILIRIKRDYHDGITDYKHISETELENITCDYEINNNSTIVQLYLQTYNIMNKLQSKNCLNKRLQEVKQ